MKKIGMILFLLFITGCTAEYNVTLDKNTISETTKIIEEDSSNLNKIAYQDIYYNNSMNYSEAWEYFTNIPIAIDYQKLDLIHTNIEYDYETYKVKKGKNYTNLTYQYDFDYENFGSSTIAHSCYNQFAFLSEEGFYYISTSNLVTCFETFPLLEKITIHISSYYEVMSNNADKFNVDKNQYTWEIARSEASNKPINIVVNTNKRAKIKKGLIEYFKENPVLIGTLIVIAVGGIIIIPIMIIKSKKNNEI